MTNPKDTIPGMTWFSNANASASSVPTNLFAALSDPTDTHSLEELRAHLEDGGDMIDLDTPLTEAQWDIVHREYERGTAVLRELSGRPARGATAMAREQQQPMSAEELDDMHQRAAEDAGENAKADADGYELPAQQPMSDARLEEIRTLMREVAEARERLDGIMGTRDRPYAPTARATLDLLAEVSRLRAREAALVEVVRAVAGGTWAAAVGQGHTPYWTALIHHETNIVEQARALLASERSDGDGA